MKQQSLFETTPEPDNRPAWERAAEADRMVARVVFNRPVETVFSYLIPDVLRPQLVAGQRIRAPFGQGNRSTVGYCVGVQPFDPQATSRRLKDVSAIVDEQPLLSAKMLDLTRWISERYLCAWGQVLDAVVPRGVKQRAGTKKTAVFAASADAPFRAKGMKLPPKQQAVMDVLLATNTPLSLEDLMQSAGCKEGPIKALREKQLIDVTHRRVESQRDRETPFQPQDDLTLNPGQQASLDAVLQTLRAGSHTTFLLHGVTGSGKTEVYLQAVREAVSYGRQAIVLVPEISLTPQTIRRFESRFERVAVLHSHMTDVDRHFHWQRIARGEVQVVVGARSAIFAPCPHLGLVVIDEEHEPSFKQESTPRYHAREVARKRAELEGIPLILGTATPTLESWHRGQQRHDHVLTLASRVHDRPMPPVSIIDVRNDSVIRNGQAIGRTLETQINTALAERGQIILFLNLRGFSPVMWCKACGESVRCPHCDLTLTWHRDKGRAICHGCEFQTDPPSACAHCSAPGLKHIGTGTQRLEAEVREKFAGVACERMDSDTMRRAGSHDEALEKFRRGETQLLLGTQMIAKGLDFPNVTLVGVIDADTMLHQPDLRAAERTFHLLAQVAGRTGRGEMGGRVLIQTANPEEPAIRFAATHDFLGFVEQEIKHRRSLAAPPFASLTRVILRGKVENRVREIADYLSALLKTTAEKQEASIRILGPAPAPLSRLKDHFRYHFQLSADSAEVITALWRSLSDQLPKPHDVEYVIDVDALNMR